MSENCKSLVLQDKCNIEIFLSPVFGPKKVCVTDFTLIHVLTFFCLLSFGL